MDYREYYGFHFAKIGIAALTEVKTNLWYDGKLIEGWDVAVNFLYPDCECIGSTTYLIFADDELMYAGEYSGTFQERWLTPRNGIWYLDHSPNDFRIQDLLKSNEPPEISIWLCLDPYLDAPNGERWNINMALERRIILEQKPKWNKRGKVMPTVGKLLRDIMKNPSNR